MMRGDKHSTQFNRVLEVLKDGPCTSSEVAAETGLPVKHCCVYLRDAWQAGIATRVEAPTLRNRYGRTPHIYTLKGT